MKILFVTHFYPPEPCAAATRVATFVAALADAGHDVTVVTNFPSFPCGRFSERGLPLVRVGESGRVRTVRLFSLLLSGIPGKRMLHWASAAAAASVYALATREAYDVVIVSSPPLSVALAGLVAAWRHRAKLVVDVRDVFPDIAIAMGAWKRDGFLARAVEKFVRLLYNRADLIVAVTPTAISQIAQRGVDASRIVLARNAAERFPGASTRNGRHNGFTAIYAGNLGLATDVDVLADAAALVAMDDITIEIVGDGAQKARLEERLRSQRIRNVVMRGSVPRQEAMTRLCDADVSIVPLRKGIEEAVPTKLYDSLSVGCPAIVVADGEAKREGAALGAICTPAGDAHALARALRQLARLERAELRRLGESGRARLERRADRAGIMQELVARIGGLRRAVSSRISEQRDHRKDEPGVLVRK